MAARGHNPVKLPLLVVLSVVIAIELVFAVVRGDWIFAAIGVVILILCASAIRAIRQGRNPWWLRAPLDRRDPPPS
jgi:uncharacterized iron-regulated membrane protein